MNPRFRKPTEAQKRRKAANGGMNDTEAGFAVYLSRKVGRGVDFEPETLELPGGVRYTPDFRTCVDGLTTYYDVKGARRTKPTKRFPLGSIVPIVTPDAAVRIKVAAALYPTCRFVVVYPNRGEWLEKEYKPVAARKGPQ